MARLSTGSRMTATESPQVYAFSIQLDEARAEWRRLHSPARRQGSLRASREWTLSLTYKFLIMPIVRPVSSMKGHYMDLHPCIKLAVAFVLLLISSLPAAHAQADTNRLVADGGISVPGWTGKIDSNAERAGQTIKDAKLVSEGAALHVTTGPAVTYWNPANKATGNYTVTATFTESKYMNLNTHPHPYGVVIAGNDMGTAQQSYLYCAAYGNGTFIVRGFGPEPFQMNGRGAENAAVHKAAGV